MPQGGALSDGRLVHFPLAGSMFRYVRYTSSHRTLFNLPRIFTLVQCQPNG